MSNTLFTEDDVTANKKASIFRANRLREQEKQIAAEQQQEQQEIRQASIQASEQFSSQPSPTPQKRRSTTPCASFEELQADLRAGQRWDQLQLQNRTRKFGNEVISQIRSASAKNPTTPKKSIHQLQDELQAVSQELYQLELERKVMMEEESEQQQQNTTNSQDYYADQHNYNASIEQEQDQKVTKTYEAFARGPMSETDANEYQFITHYRLDTEILPLLPPLAESPAESKTRAARTGHTVVVSARRKIDGQTQTLNHESSLNWHDRLPADQKYIIVPKKLSSWIDAKNPATSFTIDKLLSSGKLQVNEGTAIISQIMDQMNLSAHLHPVVESGNRRHINSGKVIHGNSELIEYALPSKGCQMSGCSVCYSANSLAKIRDIDQLDRELQELEKLTGAMQPLSRARNVVNNIKRIEA